MIETTPQQNKTLVLEAFDTLSNKRDYKAAERYWSSNYIQHSAHIAPGRDGLFNLIRSTPATLKYEPGRSLLKTITSSWMAGFREPEGPEIGLRPMSSEWPTACSRNAGMFCRMKRPKRNREAACRCRDHLFPSEIGPSSMRFGIFGAAQAGSSLPGAPMGQGFRRLHHFNVEAEALGYHSTFLVEHHFTGWNQVSATLTLLTWLAARTKTLRLGTAVMVLPWHNPVILAEQAATWTSCREAGSISESARVIATMSSRVSRSRLRRPMRASKRRLRSSPKGWTRRNASRTTAASGRSTTSWSTRRLARNRTRRSGWLRQPLVHSPRGRARLQSAP